MRLLTVGPADQPAVSIVLYPPETEPGLNDEERRTVAGLMAKGGYGRITFATKARSGPGRSR